LTTTEQLPLPGRTVFDIRVLSEIAKANQSIISLRDIASLSTNLSEKQLEAVWSVTPELSSRYELRDGLVLEKEKESLRLDQSALKREREKRARAESFANFAREFASLCKNRRTALIGISGSTSYGAASETDDLDLFCITKPDFLWVFLAQSLLLSRIFHFLRRDAPRICFSYAADQTFAEREFTAPKDALFARDALTTRVIHGGGYYRGLLSKGSWISSYFPHRYKQRTDTPDTVKGLTMEPSASSPAHQFLNLLLLTLLGNYIATKSALLNRRLRKQGKLGSLFRVRIGPDHCIFESVRYTRLRSMYHQLDRKPSLNDSTW
jgi:hypothetical protein